MKQIENTIIEALEKAQKQAEWRYVRKDKNDMWIIQCSNCGRKQYGVSLYCATCGAEMKNARCRENEIRNSN